MNNNDDTIIELRGQINALINTVKILMEKIVKFETYTNYVDQLDARMDDLENETFGNLNNRIEDLESDMSYLSSQ